MPAFAFSLPLSSVSAISLLKVKQLLLNTGRMKYPMKRMKEKYLKNYRICKCKTNFKRLTNFLLNALTVRFFHDILSLISCTK